MKFLEKKLPNGLTILGEHNPLASSSAVGFFVSTGSRDEDLSESGISHFLEHMVFKGTEQLSAVQISNELGRLGAQANAFTSIEQTVYYAAVLPEYLSEITKLYAEMMQPALDEEEFEMERKVILEEIALYQDRPIHVLIEKALKCHFGRHPAGNSILGSSDSVKSISRDEMAAYLKRRYEPSNMLIVVGGAFDWDQISTEIEDYCGNWVSKNSKRIKSYYCSDPSTSEVIRDNIIRTYHCLTSVAPAGVDKSKYAAQIYASIVGDSTGSRLFWKLIDRGISDFAGMSYDDFFDTGIFIAYAGTDSEHSREVLSILKEESEKPSKISYDELTRAKNKLACKTVLGEQSTLRRTLSLGLDWQMRGEYIPLEKKIKEIKGVSLSDVEDLRIWDARKINSEITLKPK